jgi:hypothetical protein
MSEESASWSTVLGWRSWQCRVTRIPFTPVAVYIHRQIGDHGPRIHIDLEVPDRGSAGAYWAETQSALAIPAASTAYEGWTGAAR